jgi:hypothetical protein
MKYRNINYLRKKKNNLGDLDNLGVLSVQFAYSVIAHAQIVYSMHSVEY